jgi:hypothetical protein
MLWLFEPLRKGGEPRENADLWNQLISAHTKARITVHFEWTLGKKSPVLKRVDKRQHGYRVRFNENSKYPQIVEIIEEVTVPKLSASP